MSPLTWDKSGVPFKTPRKKALEFICEELSAEESTIQFLIDLAAEDAAKSWEQARGETKERFVELACNREFLNFWRQASRYHRRHKAEPITEELEETLEAKGVGQVLDSEVSELRASLHRFQARVYDCMADGMTQAETAAQLGVSVRTVKAAVEDIREQADTFV